jgi:hypothetical protein
VSFSRIVRNDNIINDLSEKECLLKMRMKKMISASILSLALIFGARGVDAYAENIAKGAINGYYTYGSSSISSITASASTFFGSQGSVSVVSTYSYVNTSTLKVGTQSSSKGYYNTCTINFTAPAGCRSIRISSSHNISAYGQTWSAYTTATY